MTSAFMFWNINKKSLQNNIKNIAIRHNVDVIMLAESKIDPGEMLTILNEPNQSYYHYISRINSCNLQIFTKFPRRYIETINKYTNKRMAIYRITLPGLTEILLVVAHLPSKFVWDTDNQGMYSPNFMGQILGAEKLAGHSRTILVGDLNMDPFDKGIVVANGFHAVMSRKIAEKNQRTIQGIEHKFFYNPMWNLFGDSTRCPPGTYYYRGSKPIEYFWHIFDQVLIRPDLLDRLYVFSLPESVSISQFYDFPCHQFLGVTLRDNKSLISFSC